MNNTDNINSSSNGTIDLENHVTGSLGIKIGIPVVVLFSSISAIIGIVNIIYIVVCFRVFKKNVFFMLILALCSCNAVHGFSCVLFTLSTTVDIFRTNIISCQTQVFLLCFSFLSTYTFILLICLQRYITVRQISLKSYTFRLNQMFKRYQFHIIGSTFVVTFIVTFGTCFFLPRESKSAYVTSCNPEDVFGYFNFRIFYLIIFTPVTVFICLIFSLTFLTAFRIHQVIIKNLIILTSDVHRNNSCLSKLERIKNQHQDHDVCMKTEDSEKKAGGLASRTRLLAKRFNTNETRKQTDYVNFWQPNDRQPEETCPNINMTSVMPNECVSRNNPIFFNIYQKGDIEHEKTSDFSSSELVCTGKNHYKTDSLLPMKQFVTTTQISLNRKRESAEINIKIDGHPPTTREERRRDSNKNKAREYRAFITCKYIAATVILCHSPYIISVWMDIISGNPLSMETEMLLFLPISLNALLNPFLYAWRIPEMRKEFNKLCYRV